jgi:hypothetical protein
MIMRVAASNAGSSSLHASAHLWNSNCRSELSQVPLQRNLGPFYTGKARIVILSNKLIHEQLLGYIMD